MSTNMYWAAVHRRLLVCRKCLVAAVIFCSISRSQALDYEIAGKWLAKQPQAPIPTQEEGTFRLLFNAQYEWYMSVQYPAFTVELSLFGSEIRAVTSFEENSDVVGEAVPLLQNGDYPFYIANYPVIDALYQLYLLGSYKEIDISQRTCMLPNPGFSARAPLMRAEVMWLENTPIPMPQFLAIDSPGYIEIAGGASLPGGADKVHLEPPFSEGFTNGYELNVEDTYAVESVVLPRQANVLVKRPDTLNSIEGNMQFRVVLQMEIFANAIRPMPPESVPQVAFPNSVTPILVRDLRFDNFRPFDYYASDWTDKEVVRAEPDFTTYQARLRAEVGERQTPIHKRIFWSLLYISASICLGILVRRLSRAATIGTGK